MRTVDQVKRVGQNYGLNRQRMSILLHARKDIQTQEQLRAVAFDLKRAGDGLVNRLLNNIVAPLPAHRDGVQSSWGAMIPMVQK